MKKAYTLLTVLMPILSVYASPISWFDLGTFLVIIFACFCLIDKDAKFKTNAILLLLLLYTSLITLVNLFLPGNILYSDTFSIIMRLIRFVFMLTIMIGIGFSSYFDFDLIIKYLRIVTLIVAIYAIIQLLFYYATGLKLINVFGPTKQGISFDSVLGEYEVTYRPPSLFLEPSNVAYFVMPYLCYSLFHKYADNKEAKQCYVDAIIVSIGVICTTSGQGLLCLFTLWTIWLIYYVFSRKNAFIIIVFVLVMGMLFSNERVLYGLDRIFALDSDELSAVDARYQGYTAFGNLSMIFKLFGTGFGNYDENIYYSSFADILFCTGIIGLVFVLALYTLCFVQGKLYQKVLVFTSILLMFGGGVYTASLLCFYLPLLLSKCDKKISISFSGGRYEFFSKTH